MPIDLSTLEYPRHLHKGPIDYLHVNSIEEAEAARREGWHVLVDPEPEPEPVVVPTPALVIPVMPARNKPGPKPKT